MWCGEGCAWSKQKKCEVFSKSHPIQTRVAHGNACLQVWKMNWLSNESLESSNSKHLDVVKGENNYFPCVWKGYLKKTHPPEENVLNSLQTKSLGKYGLLVGKEQLSRVEAGTDRPGALLTYVCPGTRVGTADDGQVHSSPWFLQSNTWEVFLFVCLGFWGFFFVLGGFFV